MTARLVPSSHTAGASVLTEVLTNGLSAIGPSEPQRTTASGSPFGKKIGKRKQIISLKWLNFHGILTRKIHEARILVKVCQLLNL